MRHEIHSELYIELEKVEVHNAYYLKIFRQYEGQEPVKSFESLMTEKDLANFITGLQKAVMFSANEPDSSKNYGNH